MVAIPSRHKSLVLLAGVIVLQVLMLAVQPNLLNPNLLPLAFSLWRGALLVVGGLVLAGGSRRSSRTTSK